MPKLPLACKPANNTKAVLTLQEVFLGRKTILTFFALWDGRSWIKKINEWKIPNIECNMSKKWSQSLPQPLVTTSRSTSRLQISLASRSKYSGRSEYSLPYEMTLMPLSSMLSRSFLNSPTSSRRTSMKCSRSDLCLTASRNSAWKVVSSTVLPQPRNTKDLVS